MKRIIWVFFFTLVAFQLSAKKFYHIESPDKMISLKVYITDKVEYTVSHGEDTVLEKSPVSMSLTDGTGFGVNPVLRKAEIKTVKEYIDAPIYKKKVVADIYNGLLLKFRGDYALEFRVYDDGVAYRFISEKKVSFCVQNEQAVFNFPKQSKAYVAYVRENGYHADNRGNKGTFEEQFFKSFVNTYSYMNLSDWNPKRLAFMPLLVELGHGKKVCLTEADLLNYPGMYLNNSGDSDTLEGVFAPYPRTVKQGGVENMQEVVLTRENYIAKCEGRTNFPWRTLIVSVKDAELANSDMVYRLSTPNQLGDLSWIKPGKAAWEWWNSCSLYGVDFIAGINNETYKYYIRFAADNNLEYIVIDAGWYKGTDILDVVDELNLKELVEYGRERNVGIVLWTGSYPFMQDIEKVCKHYSAIGIKGFKIDFMDRDDQSMVNFHYSAAKTAAKYNLIIDFHGTYKPTGLNRTCPNVLTFEAVQGLEHMKWAAPNVDQVTYDVTMPYIRMVAGPLDYTQGTMRNASKQNYRPVNSEPMSQGTRCRQLAEYVIFESPFSMLCDSPSAYMKETECTDFIAGIPVVWDTTLTLNGEITKFLTLARKKENVWYVASINNWDIRSIELDLSFLGEGNFKAEIFRDGLNADKVARDYKREVVDIPSERKLSFTMAPGGGYIMKIFKD